MAEDRRAKLRTPRNRLFGIPSHVLIPRPPAKGGQDMPRAMADETPSSSATPSEALPQSIDPAPVRLVRAARPVAINLGIDFGTSFTKVCFRDVGTEQSGIAVIGQGPASNALVPTLLAVGEDGELHIADEAPKGLKAIYVPYLKMRLAGEAIGSPLPTVAGHDLNDERCIRALASWFLAAILVRSQRWIEGSEADRLRHRSVVWSANVGVPVEHYDSNALAVFEEVLRVSWSWVSQDAVPTTVDAAVSAYAAEVRRPDRSVADFHAIPEISAAVQSFITSRESTPGIYVYFDIGGGTVDGVAFNYINSNGERSLNFYSGRVAPLGMAALPAKAGVATSDFEAAAKFDAAIAAVPNVEDLANEVRKLVGHVVATAKRKDGRDWRWASIQNETRYRKFIGQRDPSTMKPLIVFIGGGGAHSRWYADTISSTYSRFGHHNAGIPPYRLAEVPKPADLSMPQLDDRDFRRFAISYGLSIPFGEGPEVRLPSQFSDAERPRVWGPPGVVDYANSKDVYD